MAQFHLTYRGASAALCAVRRTLCTVRPSLPDVQREDPRPLHGRAHSPGRTEGPLLGQAHTPYTLHGRHTQEAKLLLYWVPKREITYPTLQIDKNVRRSNVFGLFYKGFGVEGWFQGTVEVWMPQSGWPQRALCTIRPTPLDVQRALCTVRPTPLDVQTALPRWTKSGARLA